MRKLILALLICCTTAAFGQKINFSGTWKLDTTKTTFKTTSGEAPKNVIPWNIKVDQQADQLALTRISLDSTLRELAPVKETLAFDGTPLQRTQGENKVTTTLHWLDNASFMITRNGSMNATETWTLEDGGKTLVIDRSVEQKENGFKYTIKCVYTKVQ